VRSVVRYQTREHIFFKRMIRNCCKLAQVIHGARGWSGQLLGWKGQRSRSYDARARFGDLAEASFSVPSIEVFYLDRFYSRQISGNHLAQWLTDFRVTPELVMGHFFKTQPNPKFLDPTQPNLKKSSPDPTQPIIDTWYGILSGWRGKVNYLITNKNK